MAESDGTRVFDNRQSLLGLLSLHVLLAIAVLVVELLLHLLKQHLVVLFGFLGRLLKVVVLVQRFLRA